MTRQMEKLVEWLDGWIENCEEFRHFDSVRAYKTVREHIYALEVDKDLRKEDRQWKKRQRRPRKGPKKAD